VEWGAVVIALVPLVVFAVRAIRNRMYPVFDDALDALRIRDVFTMHPPTVGAGTSFGLIALEAKANHPGPLPFMLLAPIYAVSGFRPAGLVVSVVVYNAAFIIVIAYMARRVGGTSLLVLAMAAVLVLQRSFGGDVFTSPWNPFLALMPFTAFLFSIWATLTDGRSGMLPWAVGLGSIAVQAQAAYAPEVAILLGIAVVVAIFRAVHDRNESRWARFRPFAIALATGLVAWSLPLFQQITADDGNLGRLLRWFFGGSRRTESIGLRHAADVIVGIVGTLPPPIARFLPGSLPELQQASAVGWLVVIALLAALVLIVASRGRLPGDSAGAPAGAGLALVAIAAVVIPASKATAEAAVSTYQFISVWVVGAFALVVAAWAISKAVAANLSDRSFHVPRRLGSGVLLAAMALLIVPASRDTPDLVQDLQMARYRGTLDRTAEALAGKRGPYIISCIGESRVSLCATLIVHLEAKGVRTLVDPDSTSLYGPDVRWRFADAEDRLPTLVVSSGRWLVAPTPRARLISAVAVLPVLPGRLPTHFKPLPTGQLRLPEEQREIEDAAAVLTRTSLKIGSDDAARLRQAQETLLELRVGGRWFQGRTAQEWQALVDDEPERFVAAGGLAVLDAAGMLDDQPELRSQTAALSDHLDRDAVWLLPPGPPLGPRT
jgi:hypothetical protein